MAQTSAQSEMTILPRGKFLWWNFAIGIIVFIGGSLCWKALPADRAEAAARLLHPLASLGHGLFVMVLVGLVGEWRSLSSCRGDRANCTKESIEDGTNSLDARWTAYLALVVGPALLGMIASWFALPIPNGEPLPALPYFLPCAIGCVETLVLACVVLRLRSSWSETLETWRQELPSASNGSQMESEQRKKELDEKERQLTEWEERLRNWEKDLNNQNALSNGSAQQPQGAGNGLASEPQQPPDPSQPVEAEVVEPPDEF